MLFPFDPPRPASMWMKNTLIPLDMLFIREDGTVANIIADAAPQSLDTRNSDGPVTFVLELNGGTAARLGIVAGARVHIAPLQDCSARARARLAAGARRRRLAARSCCSPSALQGRLIYFPSASHRGHSERRRARLRGDHVHRAGRRPPAWLVDPRGGGASYAALHARQRGQHLHRVPSIHLFHDLRLNVFVFDYRGYGRSSGSPDERGTYSRRARGVGGASRARH